MENANSVLAASELREMVIRNPSIRLLDVRGMSEFESVHIAGSYNVPLDLLGRHTAEIGASVTDPVVLICQSGVRARRAEEMLTAAGVPRLHVLDGGINAWISCGNRVVRGKSRLPLDRQVRIAAGGLATLGGLLAMVAHPAFAIIAVLTGIGLIRAGATNSCMMATMLTRLPYNRGPSCDAGAVVNALKAGDPPRSNSAAARTPTAAGACCA